MSAKAHISGFSSPRTNSSGLIDFAWEKPGDRLPFEMQVDVDGDPNEVSAEIWTNANHNADPDHYESIPMKLAAFEGGRATFKGEIPVDKIGNYRAVGRLTTAEGPRWMGESGIGDVRFRPRDEAHDGLNLELVNVGMANFDPTTHRYGTFADMMESGSPPANGKYTLEWLKQQGVNALWLQPIFEIEKWDGRDPSDDAGSPYAVKDYFSVRTELSRAAKGKTGEAARDAALDEFKAFVKKCDALGIKVILDVALNHVGHNYEFRDLFVRYDEAGKEIREVRKNDFSQVAVNPEQLGAIKAKLADPNVLKYMEYLAPHLYGHYGDPHGAHGPGDTAPGGWFEWPDTKQLNHGRMRYGYSWWDVDPSVENNRTLDWLTRILRFWAVDVGVHGFRLDHLTGLPERFLERSVNQTQADVDAHSPGKNIFLMGEDFHTTNLTRHWLDAGQGGWFHELKHIHSTDHLRWIVENPWFHDLLGLGSHDEERFIRDLGGDRLAAGRLLCLTQLLGGPAVSVIGDDFGEADKLAFKQYRGVAALRAMDPDRIKLAKWKGRAGQLKNELPALKDNARAWLTDASGKTDPNLVAVARIPKAATDRPALLFANLTNDQTRSNVFRLDDRTRASIDPTKSYQIVDRFSDSPKTPLWPAPKSGQEILDGGVYVSLAPYQIEVLELREV